MALKEGSHPVICVLTGYDLNPSRMSSSIRMSGRRRRRRKRRKRVASIGRGHVHAT